MCDHGRRRLQSPRRQLQHHEPPPPPPPGYWNCTAALAQSCPHYRYADPPGCEACAAEHAPAMKAAGCEFLIHCPGPGGVTLLNSAALSHPDQIVRASVLRHTKSETSRRLRTRR